MSFQQIFANGEDGVDVRTILSFWANPTIIDRDLTAPPGGESNGDAYIVDTSATGDWVGQDGNIALYLSNETGWVFFTPQEGNIVRIEDEDILIEYNGSNWFQVFNSNETATYPKLVVQSEAVAAKLAATSSVADNDHSVLSVSQLNTTKNTDVTFYNANNTTSTTLISKRNTGALWLYHSGNNTVNVYTSGTEALAIDGSQNVSIPNGNVTINTGDSGATADTDGDDIVIENSGDAGMSILGGTTSNCTINFGDSGDANIGVITYDNNVDTMSFRTNASATDSLFLDSDNQVGINTNAAAYQLDLWTTSSIGLRINRTGSSGGSGLVFQNTAGTIQVFGLATGTNTGSFIPGANEQIDLGASAFGWNTAYIKTVELQPVTTANLPGTPATGMRAFVTDSDTAASGNFGGTFSGGGSNAVPVYYDGSDWRIG